MLFKRLRNRLLRFKNQSSSKKDDWNLALIEILGFIPNNSKLFKTVFIPRSAQYRNTQGKFINYERLEFLGDAMLGAVIAEYLFDKAPEEREGYLTQMRSKVVSRRHLNEIGKNLKLKSFIPKEFSRKITLGADVDGDMFEALVGAVYEDRGFDKCKEFINRVVIKPYVDIKTLEKRITSYKSLVLEWSQKNKLTLEFNTFEEQNAEDITIFVSIVRINGKITAKGRGTSKKKAEEKAARRTYYVNKNRLNLGQHAKTSG